MKSWFNTIFGEPKTIAVIGNAIGAITDNTRDAIESYDIICRFNNYQTSGYEEYIGKRTDIYVTTLTNWNEKNREQLKKEKIRAVYITRPLSVKYSYNANLPLMLTNISQVRDFNPKFVTEKDFDQLYKILKLDNNNNGKNPTSGLTFLYDLIMNIDFKKLYITGFDFFSSNLGKKNMLHYYKEQEGDFFTLKEISYYHSNNLEKQLFKKLIFSKNNILVSRSVNEMLKM